MASRGPVSRPVTRKRRARRKTSVMSIVWAVVTLALSITFLIVQGTLLLIFTALSVLVTALSVWVDQRADPAAVPAPSRKSAKTANPRGKRSTATVVTCTRTGRPTDVCGCPQKHVMTAGGAQRYKKRIGEPYGSAKGGRKAKEPRVPMTKNAKPRRQVSGETMRRVV
jgi:hypothetical protein